MIKLTQFSSTKNQVDFTLEVSPERFAGNSKSVDLSLLASLWPDLNEKLRLLNSYLLEDSLSDNYRKERRKHIENVLLAFAKFEEECLRVNAQLEFPLSDKAIKDSLAKSTEAIEGLSSHKDELSFTNLAITKLKSFKPVFFDAITKRIEFYEVVSNLVRGPMRAGISFTDENSFDFNIYELHLKKVGQNSLEYQHWIANLEAILKKDISALVQAGLDKRVTLTELIRGRLTPWNSFSDNLTVGEFLVARGEVMNYWRDEFTFSEAFAYHYFKGHGFFKFFEENFLNEIEKIKVDIDRKISTLLAVSKTVNIQSIYNMNLSKFLKNGRVYIDSNEAEGESSYVLVNHFASIKKTSPFIEKYVTNEILKRVGGHIKSPGVIVRPATKGGYKAEIIVVTIVGDKTEAKTRVNSNGFSDARLNKTEPFFLRFQTQEAGKIVDVDLEISYFYSAEQVEERMTA